MQSANGFFNGAERKLRRFPRRFELLTKLPRSKAGISIIVATLLLIVIAVAASVIIFSFVQGFVASTTGQSTVPQASLVFLGGINWNQPYSRNGTSLGQVTLVIRNLADNQTVESIAITDTQGNILQLVDSFNSTVPGSCTAGQGQRSFQIFITAPDTVGCASGGNVPRQSLNPGTNFLTVDFGTGTLGSTGFAKGDFQNFKVILTNGFAFNFGSRAV